MMTFTYGGFPTISTISIPAVENKDLAIAVEDLVDLAAKISDIERFLVFQRLCSFGKRVKLFAPLCLIIVDYLYLPAIEDSDDEIEYD